jgi:hypothetical protein
MTPCLIRADSRKGHEVEVADKLWLQVVNEQKNKDLGSLSEQATPKAASCWNYKSTDSTQRRNLKYTPDSDPRVLR